MKNKITDLRNHLFAQIESLQEAEGDQLKKELEKSKAIAELAQVIVNSAKIEVDYIKAAGIKGAASSGFIEDNNDTQLKRIA